MLERGPDFSQNTPDYSPVDKDDSQRAEMTELQNDGMQVEVSNHTYSIYDKSDDDLQALLSAILFEQRKKRNVTDMPNAELDQDSVTIADLSPQQLMDLARCIDDEIVRRKEKDTGPATNVDNIPMGIAVDDTPPQPEQRVLIPKSPEVNPLNYPLMGQASTLLRSLHLYRQRLEEGFIPMRNIRETIEAIGPEVLQAHREEQEQKLKQAEKNVTRDELLLHEILDEAVQQTKAYISHVEKEVARTKKEWETAEQRQRSNSRNLKTDFLNWSQILEMTKYDLVLLQEIQKGRQKEAA